MEVKTNVYRMLVIALLSVSTAAALADTERGKAAYYADSLQGSNTASGEP
ncbi:MAG: hypothetical protein V2I26_05765 [Halieaceae bacterium]|nr:hypothetical protein [Halieaceae bacterium]